MPLMSLQIILPADLDSTELLMEGQQFAEIAQLATAALHRMHFRLLALLGPLL